MSAHSTSNSSWSATASAPGTRRDALRPHTVLFTRLCGGKRASVLLAMVLHTG